MGLTKDKIISIFFEEVTEHKNNLTASDYKIREYFEENRKIIVPSYQRNYSWEEIHISDLLHDIYNNNNYFIGNIMSVKKGDTIEIIDGQQRLISVFLILCVLKNYYNIPLIEFIKGDIKNIIAIKNRAPLKHSDILNNIYENSVPSELKSSREAILYKKIDSYIKKHNVDPKILLRNLLNLKVVEVKFLDRESDAHNIFVNINTKGKNLEDIEILKSHLFKYLFENKASDKKYKEEWFRMQEIIGEKNHQHYFEIYSELIVDYKKASERLNSVIKFIDNKNSAEKIYNEFVNCESGISYCLPAGAILNYDINSLHSYLNASNISLLALNDLWKMFEKIKFKQINIIMLALLYYSTDKKRKLILNEYGYILKFVTFLLMHQIIMSLNKVSPSSYGSKFKNIAKELVNCNYFKEVIKKFLETELPAFNKNTVEDALQNMIVKTSSNNLQARYIYQILSENYSSDLKTEHIISQSENADVSYDLGNIIPVKFDKYEDVKLNVKLKDYFDNKTIEPFIEEFLKFKIDEQNYKEVIRLRTKETSEKFCAKYLKLYDELIKKLP